MGRKHFSLLIAIVAMALVMSCANPLSLSFENIALTVDASGHFTVDVSYVSNGGSQILTETYGKDGSYTKEIKTYGTAWTVASGYSGTYSYANATLLMTISLTKKYDVPSTSYVAMTAGANPSDPQTLTMGAVFLEKSYVQAFPGSGTSFSGTNTGTAKWDGSSSTTTIAFVIGTDIVETQTTTAKDTTGAVIPGSTNQTVYTLSAVTITPSGATLANGKTITYNFLSYNTAIYTWNTGTAAFNTTPTVPGGTTSNNASSVTFTLSGDGKALLFTSAATFTALRGISL